jgi:class 3 adenylate cyclase
VFEKGTGTMKCSFCKFENPENSKFCLECGRKMDFICPQCGEALPSTAKFCNQCGQTLGEAPRSSPTSSGFAKSEPKSYTPKHLAEKILNNRSALEGERKLVTVLFADVANFTFLSEKLEPEEVHQIMEGCLRILMDEIHQYEGTINQFTGDGVMALFGAPLAHEDHAQRACYAALAIQKDLAEYSEKVKKDYGREFQMRIGLNSGPVVVGSIGDDLHMDYTAIGDTINLASRMEGLAQPGTVLLSKDTHRLVKDYFDLKPIGPLEVKGKEEPQEAFELVRAGGAATRLQASMPGGLPDLWAGIIPWLPYWSLLIRSKVEAAKWSGWLVRPEWASRDSCLSSETGCLQKNVVIWKAAASISAEPCPTCPSSTS